MKRKSEARTAGRAFRAWIGIRRIFASSGGARTGIRNIAHNRAAGEYEWSFEPACRGQNFLLIASTGGHLAQLRRLTARGIRANRSVWLTFQTAQSESLLADEEKVYVPYVRPRDWRGVIRSAVLTWGVLSREQFDACISTGAGLALGAFLAARLKRVKCYYIESVSRTSGPSMTGRIVRGLRVAETYTQHSAWSDDRWRLHRSVLSEYSKVSRDLPSEYTIRRIFVTLGTISPYRFDSLVDRVAKIVPDSIAVQWQVGCTGRVDLRGTVSEYMSAIEFNTACQSADIVITHAGVGTLLELLELGVFPIVIPRRAYRAEHVDDHQEQICELLDRLGLALVREVDELSEFDLVDASKSYVKPVRA